MLQQARFFVRKEVSIAPYAEMTKLYNPLTDSLRPFWVQSGVSLGVTLYFRANSTKAVRRSFGMKRIVLAIALCAVGLTGLAGAQQRNGSLKGQVLDELGGAIIGVTVTAIDSRGVEKSTVTNDGGSYTINGLAPGKYTVRAINAGFAMYENTEVEVVAGKALQLDFTMKVAIEEQKVTIAADSRELSVEPDNNAGAVVLKGEDIDSLPDDP